MRGIGDLERDLCDIIAQDSLLLRSTLFVSEAGLFDGDSEISILGFCLAIGGVQIVLPTMGWDCWLLITLFFCVKVVEGDCEGTCEIHDLGKFPLFVLEFDWPAELLPVLDEVGPLGVFPGRAVVRIAARWGNTS